MATFAEDRCLTTESGQTLTDTTCSYRGIVFVDTKFAACSLWFAIKIFQPFVYTINIQLIAFFSTCEINERVADERLSITIQRRLWFRSLIERLIKDWSWLLFCFPLQTGCFSMRFLTYPRSQRIEILLTVPFATILLSHYNLSTCVRFTYDDDFDCRLKIFTVTTSSYSLTFFSIFLNTILHVCGKILGKDPELSPVPNNCNQTSQVACCRES